MNHLNKLTFKQLEMFHIFYEVQSFALTAKILSIHPKSITKALNTIEKILKIKLIKNFAIPIYFTDDAKILKRMTDLIKWDIKYIETELKYEKIRLEQENLKLYISISMILSLYISKRLSLLLDSVPEVSIDMKFTNNVSLNKFKEFDFSIIRKPHTPVFAESEYITDYEIVFCCGKGYARKFGIPANPEALKNHKFVFIKDYPYDEVATPEIVQNISRYLVVDNEFGAIQLIKKNLG